MRHLARKLPSFSWLFAVEILISIGIVSILIALAMPPYGDAVYKAKLSANLDSVLASTRNDVMVEMAITGEGYYPGSRFASDPVGKLGDFVLTIDGESSKLTSRGNVIRYEGKLGGKPFYYTNAPSVSAAGPIGNVIWLCGNQKAPLGWTQPDGAGTNLPRELLQKNCRG